MATASDGYDAAEMGEKMNDIQQNTAYLGMSELAMITALASSYLHQLKRKPSKENR